MALTEEDLKAIGLIMDAKLNPIIKRLDRVEKNIKSIKETESRRYSQLSDKIKNNTEQVKKNSEQVEKNSKVISSL